MNTINSFKVIRDQDADDFEASVEAAFADGWVAVAFFCTEESHPAMEAATYFTAYFTLKEPAAPKKDAAEKDA